MAAGAQTRARNVGFDALAVELEMGIDAHLAVVISSLREKSPTLDHGELGGWERLSELTRESLRAQLEGFRRGELPESCPDADVATLATLARVADLELLLHNYRLCHTTLWEAWFSLVEDAPEIPSAERRELLKRGSDYFFSYAHLVSDFVAASYRRQVQESSGTRQRRILAIKELLDGDPLAAEGLDFDLDRHHLGVVGWGGGAELAARDLAAKLERPPLILAPRSGVCWAWISGLRPFGPAADRLLAEYIPPAGAKLALGQPAFGEAGFRATHRQARRARWAGRFSEHSLIRFGDVAIELLASEDPEEARRFVGRELRGLEDDSTASTRNRETLAAYFEAGHNAASAAARLGVHQQTVANRLHAIEEDLGHPVSARRVELEVALRLRACLAEGEL